MQQSTTNNNLTRKDLQDELKRFPTKQELKIELDRFITKEELKKELNKFATKDNLNDALAIHETRFDIKLDNLERKIDDKAKKYRDQVLNGIEKVISRLDSIYTEHSLRNRDILGHEKRNKKLEKSSLTA